VVEYLLWETITMLLWTWHEPDFLLTEGRVDHTRSEYYITVPGVRDAYANIARRLSTDQIIWCYVRRDGYHRLPKLTRIEWSLNVPNDGVLAVIDSFVWNKILRIETFPPMSLHFKWREQAPLERVARDAFLERKIKEYHAQPEPPDGWWSQLFIKDTSVEGATVLLRHPIPKSWVVRVAKSAV